MQNRGVIIQIGALFALAFTAGLTFGNGLCAHAQQLTCPPTATAQQCAQHYRYATNISAPQPLSPGQSNDAMRWPDQSTGASVGYREPQVRGMIGSQ